MELPEPISWINKRLQDEYGSQDLSKPYWRIVWSEDQLEKRLGTFRDIVNGIFIREVTEVREVPKYRQWIREKYVLERLIEVPAFNLAELLEKKLSYEPVWVFENSKGEFQPPLFRIAKFIIETVHQQASKSVGVKYKDPDLDPKESLERQRIRIDKLQEELFGNETEVGTSLSHKEGVGYTGKGVKE